MLKLKTNHTIMLVVMSLLMVLLVACQPASETESVVSESDTAVTEVESESALQAVVATEQPAAEAPQAEEATDADNVEDVDGDSAESQEAPVLAPIVQPSGDADTDAANVAAESSMHNDGDSDKAAPEEVEADSSASTGRIAAPTDGTTTPAIRYERSGGMTGRLQTWDAYTHDFVLNPTGRETNIGAGEVNKLLAELDSMGFFALEDNYIPKDTCCDRFQHVVTVTYNGQTKTISVLDATPEVPDNVWQILQRIREVLQVDQVGAENSTDS